MGTRIEALAIGNCLLRKEEQPSSLKENYTEMYDLD
jgi:carbamoyltransferase